MSDVFFPPARFAAPAAAAASSGVAATITHPPPSTAALATGSIIRGTVTGTDAKGQILVQTDFGILPLQTKAKLAAGNQVTLQVRVAGSELHVVILRVETGKDAPPRQGGDPGANLGDDVSYSGTVSAAIEATMLGIPSIALSLASSTTGPLYYETAAVFGVKLAGLILERGLPQDTLLNVNVPNVSPEDIAGLVFTRRGRRLYEDAIKETFDPWGRKHYWIGGGTPSWDAGEDTDSAAISVNKISITPMHLDPTNYEAIKTLRHDWTDLLK